ncbi:MAG: Rne/Rng family ribonuclease [Labedaea sp.]
MSDTTPAGRPGGNPTTSINLADLPAKIRVHALAKLLQRSSREVLDALIELGEDGRSAQSGVNRDVALKVAELLLGPSEEEPEPEPAAAPAPARTVAPPPVPVFASASPLFLSPDPAMAPAKAPAKATKTSDKAPDKAPDKTSDRAPAKAPAKATKAPAKAPAARPAYEVEEPDEDEADGVDDVNEAADVEDDDASARRRRRRGRRGRGRGKGGQDEDGFGEDEADEEPVAKAEKPSRTRAKAPSEPVDAADDSDDDDAAETASQRRRRRRRRRGGDDSGMGEDDPPNTVVHVREARDEKQEAADARSEVRSVRGSTRLEAKRQRRRDGREAGRRRAPILSEAEFLARRESVDRAMVVRERGERTQIAVLEDGVLVEHFVTTSGTGSLAGNVYLGRVQNVLPSMEAAFVDIGRGRNAVLYAGEVDWDAAGLEGKARKIEQALSTGDSVLVQVTKDPVGHKGARLTTQISLPGRFLVYVPGGGATGISRKLPENERRRLKDVLKRVVPEDAGVIIRTASEGISEEELARDVRRLQAQWQVINDKTKGINGAKKASAPSLLYEEPDLLIKVVRDLFTEDFSALVIEGGQAWETIDAYVSHVAPELVGRLRRHVANTDVFAEFRVDEQLLKALDRKVWLPSGGYLVIDRTEAMTVIDVNTGKFTGSGGNLEETVTRNNLESAEEIVRQLRLRDIGGIIVIDFIDMVLESNRDLVLRRLTECLGRDRTRHQVAEVTSLGLVQMTRKRVGTGLLEAFSTPCEHCKGRGVLVVPEQISKSNGQSAPQQQQSSRRSRGQADKDGKEGGSSHAARAAVRDIAKASGVDPAVPDELAGDTAGAPAGGQPTGEPALAPLAELLPAPVADRSADSAAAGAPVDAEAGLLADQPASGASAAADPPASDSPAAGGPGSPDNGEFAAPWGGRDADTPADRSAAEVHVPPQADGTGDSHPETGGTARRRRAASRPAGPPVSANSDG